MGDVGAWRAHGGSKEARVTLKHNVQGQSSPALQVKIKCTQIFLLPCSSVLNITVTVNVARSLGKTHRVTAEVLHGCEP